MTDDNKLTVKLQTVKNTYCTQETVYIQPIKIGACKLWKALAIFV